MDSRPGSAGWRSSPSGSSSPVPSSPACVLPIASFATVSLPPVLLSRSMHPRYLSNAFVVGEGRGGAAVFVDSGAPIMPLLQFVSTHSLRPTHLLRTHSHSDTVRHTEEHDLPLMTPSIGPQ